MQYLIGLTIIHILLMAGYWLFLKNETQYQRMRWYILSVTWMALIIPMLHFPAIWHHPFSEKEAISAQMSSYILQPVPVIPQMTNHANIDYFTIICILYCGVTAFFLFRLLRNILILIGLKQQASEVIIDEIRVQQLPYSTGTFSFFNWIFISENYENEAVDYLPILRHELAHVKLKHSYDLLLLELFRAFFWWLPSA